MSVQVWKAASEPPVNRSEILRYAGGDASHADTVRLMEDCLAEMAGQWQYAVCYSVVPVKTEGQRCDFGAFFVSSASLASMLSGVTQAVVMAATVGVALDRRIQKYTRLSPSKAMMLQAVGAERIEALCDAFCRSFAASDGAVSMRRFSPGYGDWSLEGQRELFRLLNPAKHIGLSLTDSLMMVPSKSVTAIAVCSMEERFCSKIGCRACRKHDCAFRGDL